MVDVDVSNLGPSKMRAFDARGFPQPRDETLFPAHALTVDLEIGCGVGLHPIQLARQLSREEPNRVLVAIERTKTRYESFARRMAHHPDVTNVVPVNDDAVNWITHRVPASSLSRVFLLYPNPYPKSRQRNKRWYAMPFMGRLKGCLRPGGTLHLATNMAYYAQEAREALTRSWGMTLVSERVITGRGDVPWGGRTHFERKYLERGERCYDLVFRR